MTDGNASAQTVLFRGRSRHIGKRIGGPSKIDSGFADSGTAEMNSEFSCSSASFTAFDKFFVAPFRVGVLDVRTLGRTLFPYFLYSKDIFKFCHHSNVK